MEAVQKMEGSQEVNEAGLSPPMENNVPIDTVKNCNLCGCSAPAVRCDKCGSQTFCLSCDDMYHRHPKRRFHLRKAVDSIWNLHKSPRFRRRTELPGDPSKIPVPPPRTKKRHFSSDFGSMFRPNFQIPGFKGYFSQKTTSDMKGQELSDKSVSPVSPEFNYENSVGNGLPNVNDDNKVKSLQRQSSPENLSASNSSPVNMQTSGVSPMQVDAEDRNNPGFPYHFHGHAAHHSMSSADLSATSPQTVPPIYPFPPHMHPFYPPHLNPYPGPMAPFNCPQCLHASWSNLMSSGMAQYHQHHHIPQQMGVATATLSHTGTLKTHSPSPDTVMRQNQNAAYQGFFNANSPVTQGGVSVTSSATSPAMSFVPVPDHTSYMSPSPAPVSPQTTEAQNAMNEGQNAQLQQILASDEEMEEEGDNAAGAGEEEVEQQIPEKPTEPWACVHCTYINPPGSHICDVCCKTSYNVSSTSKKGSKRKRDKQQEATGTSDSTAIDTSEGPSTSMGGTSSTTTGDAKKVMKL